MWNELFAYAVKSAIALTLLYAPYTLLLRKERFFRQNRFTLLAIMALSLVLPFCDFHALYPGELLPSSPTAPAVEVNVPAPISITVPMGPMTTTEVSDQPFRLLPWLCYLYIIGALIVLAIHLWQFTRMHRLIRKGCLWSDVEDGIVIHCHADGIAPCSWMRHIVISEHDYRHHRHEILLHEKGHVRCLHSWDILLLTLVQTIQWYNPFAYMLGASLRDVHEYEADDYVLRQGVTASEYQTLLLKTAVGNSAYTFANNFNHSLTKNRIVMMKKQFSSSWKRYKALYILPLVVVLLSAFATPNKNTLIEHTHETSNRVKVTGTVIEEKSQKPISGVNVLVRKPNSQRFINGSLTKDGNFSIEAEKGDVLTFSLIGMQSQTIIIPEDGAQNLTVFLREEVQSLSQVMVVSHATNAAEEQKEEKETTAWSEEEIFAVVEQMPVFPGGMGECMKFFAMNLRYPAVSQEACIEGEVIVEFLVGKDGSISEVKVKRGVSPELDAEAIRVVSKMPNWTPGKQRGKPINVRYEIPIMFSLQK